MIGGNTKAQLQIMTRTVRNEIGERVPEWETVHTIPGWLDLVSGDSKRNTFDAKIQDSTHVFICDYMQLDSRVKAENSRLIDEDGLLYDVLLIDDPMKLHQQLEIYLKYTGGQ